MLANASRTLYTRLINRKAGIFYMTILFIILLVCAEIALLVLTLKKQREQSLWLRNRAITRGIEFVLLLGIVLLPITHLKWRYTGTLILLGVLLLIAGLAWLLKRKKATGEVKKGKAIASAILSVLLILPALTPAFLFANYNGLKPTGAYEIKQTDAILTDSSRIDSFETDGSLREVPVHFYYPDADGSFPLIVFSHGAFGYYQSNYSTYAELASNGYVVAALDHPHHAFFSKDTDGKLVLVDNGFLNDAVAIQNADKSAEDVYTITRDWMQLRMDDTDFVLDTIEAAKADGALNGAWHTEHAAEILSVLEKTDTGRIGLMGHSMGGATAVSVGRMRSDVGAVIVLDGTMLGEITGIGNDEYLCKEEPYPVPILDLRGYSDYSREEPVNDRIVEHAVDGRVLEFGGVGHMDFTDLPLFSPFLSSMLGSENIDHAAFMNRINGIVLNWFDYYLKGTGALDLRAEY